MKKIIILLLVSALILPGLALAANDVTVPQATNIVLPSDGYTYVISANSTFDSMTVADSIIYLAVSASSSFILTSGDNQDFTIGGANSYVSHNTACGSSSSVLTIAVSSEAPSSYTLTITPAGRCSTLTPSGGSPSSSSGSFTPFVPTTPVSLVTPVVSTPNISTTVATPTSESSVVSPDDATALTSSLGLARNATKESTNQTKVSSDLKEFKLTASETQKTAMNNFVTYGVSTNTINLGEGERRAVLRDYMDTVKRAEVDWSDVEKITTGQKPVNRNLKNEQAQVSQVLATFAKVMGHNPNFKNAKDDLTWNTMMYRIRFTRDLAKEKQGISAFQTKFKRTPKSPLDWSTVRALGYVK